MDTNKRGQWGSNFGFLMATIGAAIGLGNLWAFPYKMGKGGGFAFLVLYLIMVAVAGVALMLGEFAIGRKTGLGAGKAYAAIGKKYRFIGTIAGIVPFIILSFYCVLGGMVLRYCLGFLLQLLGRDGFSGQGSGFFGTLLYDGKATILFFLLFLVITMTVVMGGVQGGIERFSKAAMPALAVILVVIIVFVAIQPGAEEGYAFMFKPDLYYFSNPEIFFSTLKTASGQMFFSLSIAMGINITFGSYLDKKRSLQKNAVVVPLADTLFALLAGMMIMPACAAFGVDYGSGPGLLFVSMQKVFLDGMGGFTGNLMGFLFFFLVFIAAITSSIGLLEVLTSWVVDTQMEKGKEPSRKRASMLFAAGILLLGLPVCLDALGSGGATIPAPYELFGLTTDSPSYAVWNDCWLDFYDMISEGFLMPVGGLLMVLMLGWKKPDLVKDECEASGLRFRGRQFFRFCYRYLIPVVLAVVLYAQITSFFNLS